MFGIGFGWVLFSVMIAVAMLTSLFGLICLLWFGGVVCILLLVAHWFVCFAVFERLY